MSGYIWSGSVGARVVEMLRGMPAGTVIETPELADAVDVPPRRLHWLLQNAVKLRMLKKVHTPGRYCVGWTLGAGQIGATIETKNPNAKKRRPKAAAPRPSAGGAAPAPSFLTPGWPPQFVSQFDELKPRWVAPPASEAAPNSRRERAQKERESEAENPRQLPLFRVEDIGRPGRRRLRRLGTANLSEPASAFWDQVNWLDEVRAPFR